MQLRYYQKQAVNAPFKYWERTAGVGNPVIVLPTGSGKSFVQAEIINKILFKHPDTRILCITHQKTLIEQNYNEFTDIYPFFRDVGIYSAGLKRRDIDSQVLFCGIQSVYKKSWQLGPYEIMIIDECHLVPKKSRGMYRKFIDEMQKQYRYFKVIGLTATCYRLDSGILTDGEDRIFSDICYNVLVSELIKKGYLCNLISQNASKEAKADLSSLHIRGGEYISGELADVMDKDILIQNTVKEIKKKAANRNCLLVFCTSIKHAEHVSEELNEQGINAAFIHSKQDSKLNDQIIQDFRDHKIRALCNVDMLTTGFNVKKVDCICMLRPTKSPGLYYQMAGRGLRIHEEKEDCLILDFAGNIAEHGPIDKIYVKSKLDGSGMEVGKCPMKECPECNSLLFISQMECPDCGYIYPERDLKHDSKASNLKIISTWEPPVELPVSKVDYEIHKKEGKPDSIKITFHTGMLQSYNDYICIEHGGPATHYAKKKLNSLLKVELPVNEMNNYKTKDILEMTSFFKEPKSILVDFNNKFPQIKKIKF